MNFDDYVAQSLRTERPLESVTGSTNIVWHALEVLMIAGALADVMKKWLIYGSALDEKALDMVFRSLETQAGLAADAALEPMPPVELPFPPRVLHAALGACGEAGELIQASSRPFYEGDPGAVDGINVVEELGDLAWYLAMGADECRRLGFVSGPADVLRANVAKLRERYPNRFDIQRSEGRDVAAERSAMEGGSK